MKNSKKIKKRFGELGNKFLNRQWGFYNVSRVFNPKLTFEKYLEMYL